MIKYYRLLVDPNTTSRWYLKAPLTDYGEQIDPRIFTSGCRYDGVNHLKLPLRQQGEPIDFNFCDFDMIVTPRQLNDTLEQLVGQAVERIPVDLELNDGQYEILNVVDTVSCIDDEKSEFMKWQPQDGRPDKVGEYRMITKLVIDSDKARNHTMFRIEEWKIALIVDDSIKRLFEEKKVTGVIFQSVS